MLEHQNILTLIGDVVEKYSVKNIFFTSNKSDF